MKDRIDDQSEWKPSSFFFLSISVTVPTLPNKTLANQLSKVHTDRPTDDD